MRQRRGIAKLSGVSVHTLSNLETGEGNVTLDTLHKVAVACHMDGHAP
ncbi:MAG: helix-turn-helix transcriptional regulator [Verrucomicrobiota bacterium]|nr:helix-turn-helix transcriptional regulator [Verrucomicrobiota bacterium]